MKKICFIFGGESSEHDISIITGMQMAKEFENANRKIEKIYLGLDNKFYYATKLKALSDFQNKEKLKLKEVVFSSGSVFSKSKFFKKLFDVDCVVNCCHGGVGENGDLAGYFELNKIRYTSSDCLSSHIAMDKDLTKQLVKDVANVVDGVKISKLNFFKSDELIQNLNNNLIVKPNSLGSSIGVAVKTKADYKEQVEAIFELNDDALIENRVMNLLEYNQACFRDDEKLILSEIENPILKNNFLTFDDKYISNTKSKGGDRVIPAKISKKLRDEICSTTLKIYEKLNMNGVVRIDYIYDVDNKKLYFNEINSVPGSLAFYLYEPIGVDTITLIEKLVKNSRENKKYNYFNTNVLSKKI